MPCAEGELCLQQNRTPKAPHGHVCKGGCGGRLHGTCGSVEGDFETSRICSSCVAAKTGKRKATAAGVDAGAGPSKRPTEKGGGKKASRARLSNADKVEVLKLLDAKISHEQIADRFKCSERLVRKVKAERKEVEAKAAAGDGSQKTARRGDFPEVGRVHDMPGNFLSNVVFPRHFSKMPSCRRFLLLYLFFFFPSLFLCLSLFVFSYVSYGVFFFHVTSFFCYVFGL